MKTNQMNKAVQIKEAAIKDENGIVHTLPRPNRHHNILNLLFEQGIKSHLDGQGFVLDDGTWVDRVTAAQIVLQNGQCERLLSPPDLYSEDLW
jgi:hypothetical protein